MALMPLVGPRNRIWSVKTSASDPFGKWLMLSGWVMAQITMWVQRVSACPVRMLNGRMTGDGENQGGQPGK